MADEPAPVSVPVPSTVLRLRNLHLSGRVRSGETLRNRQYSHSTFHRSEVRDGSRIEHCTFDDCRFEDCTFEASTFLDCRFRSCTFVRCTFSRCDFTGSSLVSSRLLDCRFEEGCRAATDLDFDRTVFEETRFNECLLTPRNLETCTFRRVRFESCQPFFAAPIRFEGRQLAECTFRDCDLSKVLLEDCQLAGSTFQNVQGEGMHFARANLERATFRGCTLPHSDFRGATLRGASFFFCDLRNSYLNFASFDGARISDDFDLSGCRLDRASFRDLYVRDLDRFVFEPTCPLGTYRGADLWRRSQPIERESFSAEGSNHPGLLELSHRQQQLDELYVKAHGSRGPLRPLRLLLLEHLSLETVQRLDMAVSHLARLLLIWVFAVLLFTALHLLSVPETSWQTGVAALLDAVRIWDFEDRVQIREITKIVLSGLVVSYLAEITFARFKR